MNDLNEYRQWVIAVRKDDHSQQFDEYAPRWCTFKQAKQEALEKATKRFGQDRVDAGREDDPQIALDIMRVAAAVSPLYVPMMSKTDISKLLERFHNTSAYLDDNDIVYELAQQLIVARDRTRAMRRDVFAAVRKNSSDDGEF